MKNEIIIFENQEIKLEVNMKDETVWLTQEQIAELFETTKRNIEMHIKNIYEENELEENSTSKDFFQVQIEGNREVKRNRKIYNLDMIISVGYRVKSKNGIAFRKWANQVLKENLKVSKRGGDVAKGARNLYEKETGNSAITSENAIGVRYIDNKNQLE